MTTIAKKKKKHGPHSGKKRKMGKAGKKRTRSRKRMKGILGLPASGMGRYLMQVVMGALGYVGASWVRNNLIPKWWTGAKSPQDIFMVTGIGLGLMYLDRKGQNEIFYIGLGMAGYGVGELATDFIPGLQGIANYDTTAIEKRIMAGINANKGSNRIAARVVEIGNTGLGSRVVTIGKRSVKRIAV